MDNLSFVKVVGILRKNIKLITLFTIIGLVVGVLYALFVYKPTYVSTSSLLIKNQNQPSLVTELDTSNRLTGLARDSNPALTQIQILSSNVFAEKVWNEISKKYKLTEDTLTGIQLMKSAISVESPVGTDILEVSATWSDPNIAKDIADGFVKAYISSNIDDAKKGIVQSKNSIDSQLMNAETSLEQVRNQIRQFKQSNFTVDLPTEAASMVNQIGSLENRYSEIASTAHSEANKVSALASKLGIEWSKAINSVALGHNTNIAQIQQKLGTAQEELSGISTKYAQTHPAVIALNAKIDQMKNELSDQIKQTVGSTVDPDNLIISDPVRTQMMQELVDSEANYRGLAAQAGVLKSAINNLNARKSFMPAKEHVLATLMQQEENWATVVNTLKAKQIEANIKESEVVGNVNVIDNADLPLYPVFPARSHVTLLFGLMGLFFGIISVIASYLASDSIDDVEQMEKVMHAPVLGIIPWLEKRIYNSSEAIVTPDNSTSYYNLAYQKIISTFRIRGYNSGIKSILFTSSEFSKSRSTILANIAYGLNKTGQSVIIVDADLRTPSIHKEFGLSNNEKFNLAELLTNISREVLENGEFNWNYLNYFTQEASGATGLHVLTSNSNVSDPNEFLHSPAFNMLIQKLKERYDWILIDAPPAMAVPDAVTIGSIVDGVAVTTGLDSTKSSLKNIYKLFNDNQVKIFGVVARQYQPGEAVTSNEYLKQIISRMLPQEDDVLVSK